MVCLLVVGGWFQVSGLMEWLWTVNLELGSRVQECGDGWSGVASGSSDIGSLQWKVLNGCEYVLSGSSDKISLHVCFSKFVIAFFLLWPFWVPSGPTIKGDLRVT